MAEVPYTGAPTVAPQDRPTPYRSLDVPQAAFGGASAQATERLGASLSNVGNELFTRAYAMQELDQQAKANEALANFQNQQLKHWTDFEQRMGKDAYDHLDEFNDSMEGLRAQIRNNSGLSPYAQKLYDGESRNSAWRMRYSAAYHSSAELRKYTLGANKARQDSLDNTAGATPMDQSGIDALLKQKEDLVRQAAGPEGLSPEETELEVQKAKSKLVYNQLLTMGDREPIKAQKLAEHYIDEKVMVGDDVHRMRSYLKTQVQNVWTRKKAAEIRSGVDGGWGDGEVSMGAAKAGIAAVESAGGDYSARGPVVTSGRYKGQRGMGKYMVMPGNLSEWLSEAGMPQMSEQAFMASPDAQEQLFEARFGKRMKELGSFDRAMSEWFTGNPDALRDEPGRSDKYTTMAQYAAKAHAAMAQGATEQDILGKSDKVAARDIPDDPVAQENLRNKTMIDHNNDRRAQAEAEMMNKDKLLGRLEPGPDGRVITTKEEYLSDPETRRLYNGLKRNKDREAIDKMILANAATGGYQMTYDKYLEYGKFVGAYMNPWRSADDVKYLQDYNAEDKNFSFEYMQKVRKMQADLWKARNQPAMARMQSALKTLGDAGILRDAGIDPTSTSDKVKQFRGALHQLIEDHIRDMGKPPDETKIKEWGARLIEDQASERQHYYFWPYKAYQLDIPPTDYGPLVKAWRDNYGTTRMPSKMELHSFYIAKLVENYQALYQKKPEVPRAGGPR